jgi:hypothetical protein
MRDPSVGECDHINAVDSDAADLGFKLQHRAGGVSSFTDISEAGAAEHFERTRQVFESDVAPALWPVHARLSPMS